MKTKIMLLSMASAFVLFTGCGGGSSENKDTSIETSDLSAQLIDSEMVNVGYETQTYNGVTDREGFFKYSRNDTSVVFKIGNLIIGEYNLSKLGNDKKITPADLLGIERNNTLDERLVNMITFLQSLDSDNNVSNGIQISDEMKTKISDILENNSSLAKNLDEYNITKLNVLAGDVNITLIDSSTARRNYRDTLESMGIENLDFLPFKAVIYSISGAGSSVEIQTDNSFTYNFTINWGDGSIDSNVTASISHVYSDENNYTIEISGEFPHIYIVEPGTNKNLITNIIQWGDVKWKSFAGSFKQGGGGVPYAFVITASDTPDLREVEDMSYMFAFANFDSNINNWNVSNVNDMSYMFYASNFNQPLDKWNVSNVTDMSSMFAETPRFNQSLDTWNVSRVKNMSLMFYMTSVFNGSLNEWNTSSVNNMNSMFMFAQVFNQPLNKWNVGNVTDMSYMFSQTPEFNQSLNDWNVSNVVSMQKMFYGAVSFNQPLSAWNTGNVEDMSYMFQTASAFNQDIYEWNTSKVTTMRGMFQEAGVFDGNISEWDTSNVIDMSYMFYMASEFNKSIEKWNTSKVTDMSSMFTYASSFNQPLDSWDVSRVTKMESMFSNAVKFNQPLNEWNTSGVTTMMQMFSSAYEFNQPLNSWDVSNVTIMYNMFNKATSFNQPLDQWDTSSVTTMHGMFYYAENFDQNISNWNVSKVTDYSLFDTGSPIEGTTNEPDFQ